jgi:hypothetical protein
MPRSKPPRRRRKLRRANDLRTLTLEATKYALLLNTAVIAQIDESISQMPPGGERTKMLTLRAELKSHRPGLLESHSEMMRP